jgi:hypothetical protein
MPSRSENPIAADNPWIELYRGTQYNHLLIGGDLCKFKG